MFGVGEWQFQLLTFVLELGGLTLAFIEVRLPQTAARIARFLGELAAPVEELRRAQHREQDAGNLLASRLGTLLNTVLTVAMVPLIIYFAISTGSVLLTDGFSLAWFVPRIIGFVVSLVALVLVLTLLCILLYFTVAAGSDFTTRFVEGRAVGTLGIVLATFGLALEAYQLLTVVQA